MVDVTRQDTVGLWGRMLGQDRPRQLELPLEGLPSMRRRQLLADARVFATSFGPKLGVQLLMRVGVPMVAVTTPAVIDVFAPERGDDWKLNLAVGGALGGVWGAMVGAVVPVDGTGARTSRFRAAGFGAAGGVVLAPAVAAVSKYVVDRVTAPIARDRDEAEAEAGTDATKP